MAAEAPLVLDATVIIYLSKAGVLRRLVALGRSLLVPAEVYQEVVIQGKAAGAQDAFEVERLAEEGILRVEGPLASPDLEEVREPLRGSDADAAVLLRAESTGGTVVSDDRRLRRLASLRNREVTGSAGILLALVKQGELSKEEGRQALDAMVEAGWWCDTRIYSKIIRRLGF